MGLHYASPVLRALITDSPQNGIFEFVVPVAGTITRVEVTSQVPATGTCTFDLHKNGTTIFTDQSTRPVIAFLQYSGARSGLSVAVSVGDVLRFDADSILGGCGGPLGLIVTIDDAQPARGDVQLVTASLANNAEAVGTVALGKSFELLKVVVSHAARVRLYSTAGARTADAARPVGTDPTAGAQHQIICDLNLDATTGLVWLLSPSAFGFNGEASVSAAIPYAVQNKSGGAQAVTVTFTRLSVEG